MNPEGASLDESLVSDGTKWGQLDFQKPKGHQEAPLDEWCFHVLPDFEEWERLWLWEFGREKLHEDEDFKAWFEEARQTKNAEAKKMEALSADIKRLQELELAALERFEEARQTKNAEAEAEKMEALSADIKRLQELELAALERSPSTLEVLFPYYVEEWPECPYLSIDSEERSEFREAEGESGNQHPEMDFPIAGGETHTIHIDPSWPASVAKKKFAEWYEYVGGGQDGQSSHGRLRRLRGDLKALGVVRLRRLLGEGATWGDVLDYAIESPLYQDEEQCSKALRRVHGVLEKWFTRPVF